MSYECLALNKSGKCCRNWTEVLEDGSSALTCHMHRNFFNNPEHLKLRVLWNRGMFLEWADHGLQRRIGEWLEHGLVRIDASDFHQFQPDVLKNFAILFLLVARHTKVDLTRNAMLWISCVKWLWLHSWRIAWSKTANPHTISPEDMITILCQTIPSTENHAGGVSWFYSGLYLFPDEQRYRNTMSEDDWFAFFNQTLEDPVWAHTFWATDTHLEIINTAIERKPSLRDHPLTLILTGERYKAWLLESKKAWYECQKQRMNCVKEELVAVTYHPSRFITWTITHEDQAELARNWDDVSEVQTPLAQVLEEVRVAFGLHQDITDN
jgi:hypothetical protein